MILRRVLVALLALPIACLALGPGPASAHARRSAQDQAEAIEAAAAALRRSPVYVDPAAERALSGPEIDQLDARIREAGHPIFVAVLPASVAGSADPAGVAAELVRRTGLSGTYAVIVGDSFRATSTSLGNADEIATASFQAGSGAGTFSVLDEFVQRAAAAGSGGKAAPTGTDTRADTDQGGGSLVPLAVLAAGGGGLLLWARRRRRRSDASEAAEQRQAMAADRQMLQAQLAVLADDVIRLEPAVAVHPDARTDYDAAVERYRIAAAALDYADEPIDLVRVQRVVEEASYAMARARAITEGRTPPEPPPDLRRLGPRNEPALDLDQTGTPVYVGGAPFYGGGWYGGYGGGGGLFGGLLLGSMLGGFGPFGMWGGNHIEINHHGEGDGWGGGSEGGDWGGGGGFGGGDFGGGDFGGGDW